MEFDILNELLTSTVAQLFTDNEQRQQSMLKNSTQMGQDKREIPRQGSVGLLMQTPEKGNGVGAMNDLSGPSPTGEKLQQILSGGGNLERNRSQDNFS